MSMRFDECPGFGLYLFGIQHVPILSLPYKSAIDIVADISRLASRVSSLPSYVRDLNLL